MMASENRRIGIRVPVNFKVDYIHKGDYILSFNKNISVDGMFICTEKPPTVGQHLQLVFPVQDIPEVEVAAIVIWVKDSGPPQEQGMGVQFLSPLEPQLKEYIVHYVDRVAVLEKDAEVVN
jgi:uncharacterized protein (TIGR02266 family)